MARNIFGDDEEDDPVQYPDPYQQDSDPGAGGGGVSTLFDDPEVGGPVGPGAGTGGYPPQPDGTPGGPGPTGPAPTSGGTNTGGSAFDEAAIRAAYQKSMGRAPTPEELASDMYAASRYGATSGGPTHGVVGQILARGNNTPGSGVLGNPNGGAQRPGATSGGNGTGGAGGAGGTGNANMDALLQTLIQRLTGSQPSYTSPLRDQLLSQLQTLITEGSKPVGPVDQTPEALAFRGAQDRGASDMRSALMERRAAQGVNLGGNNIDTDVLGIEQEKAQAQSQFEAKLSHDLLTDKKDRLERALNLGAGIISDEQRAFAQQQLSQVNSAIALFTSLQSNQYNYDYLGYLLGSQEGNANAGAANL